MIINDNVFGATKQTISCQNCGETILHEVVRVKLIKRCDDAIVPSYRELAYICPNCQQIVYSKPIPLEG